MKYDDHLDYMQEAAGAAAPEHAAVPEHMSPLAELAASERASAYPRQRRLWALDNAARLEAEIASAVPVWRKLSMSVDLVCLAARAISPLAPAPLAVLSGRGVLPTSPLWARYVHCLGRLSFSRR